MDITTLKKVVAAYAHRATSAFLFEGTDLLLLAINNAKKWAQRKHDFELNRVAARVQVDLTSGGSLSTAVLHSDGVTPVDINRVERAMVGMGTPAVYRPAEYVDRGTQVRRLNAAWDNLPYEPTTASPLVTLTVPVVTRQGGSIFLWPADSNAYGASIVPVGLDVVQWLPDYSDSLTSDFFIDNCSDWLIYRSLRELQFFIKEDLRTGLTDEILKDAWDSVLTWDESLTPTDANNLD